MDKVIDLFFVLPLILDEFFVCQSTFKFSLMKNTTDTHSKSVIKYFALNILKTADVLLFSQLAITCSKLTLEIL